MKNLSRRDLLRSGGALVVSFAMGTIPRRARSQQAPGAAAAAFDLDSFLAIDRNGRVTISTSHVDPGTGITTIYRQIAAEELGIPVERFTVVQGDTAATPDHGGTGGSSGVPRGGADIRRAAATARRALLELGARQLGQPQAELTIEGGEVRPISGGKGIVIGALIGGKRFDLKVDPRAPLKDPATYTVVGKPILRTDLPGKATGRHAYVHDYAVPEMLHARVVRPPSIGARLLSVDESSIRGIPDARVVRLGSFLGVVAKDEWAAVRAARELKTTWNETRSEFATEGLDAVMRAAPVEREQVAANRGDVTAALSTASRRLTASYYWPFQSHGSLAPSCAIADVKEAGTTVWSSTQDTYGLRNLIARQLDVPRESVRVVYLDGSGSYGSNGAFDAAADAALISRALRRPVRLQWMRHDEHGWDPKGPAQLLQLSGGLDNDGRILAWESVISGPSGPQWTEAQLGPSSAGQPTGAPRPAAPPTTQNLDPPYAMPHLRVTSRLLSNTPIRLSNLRAPLKIGNVFAVESFTDELAAAARMDAAAFRRQGLTDPRALAVIDRAAAMIGWQPRPSPARAARQGIALAGRGIAYMRYKQAENYVAIAMEVSVDAASGRITVQRIACAHDCGLIMNPDGLRNQVEGNILHTLSRTLHEEVAFADGRVTSVDWTGYPILRFPEAPAIEVALINHSDQPPNGAGEAACAPVAAALANAIFDATGARLRRVPFAPARLRAALSSGG